MDLEDEEWVEIPYEGLLEVNDDGGKKIFSRKHVRSPKNYFKMDYFNPSQKFQEFDDLSSEEDLRLPKQLIPLPIQTDDDDQQEEEVKEMTKVPILTKEEVKGGALESDLDPVFQVFFKKENEYVEMKTCSPRSSVRGITLPQIETRPFQSEDESDNHMLNYSSPSKKMNDEANNNVWKWGLSGIGTFCSLGMAAATICFIIFGNGQRHKQQSQKLRIQTYSDDKRIKQVVHNANEAMSTMRGVPLARAHITYGGYYEGL